MDLFVRMEYYFLKDCAKVKGRWLWKSLSVLTSPCFSLLAHLGFWQCVCVNDEVSGLLTFPPASMSTPLFWVLIFQFYLSRFATITFCSDIISTLILISYWNWFSSPSHCLPFLIHSWGLFKCWFYFSKCFQKKERKKEDPMTPTFWGIFLFFIWGGGTRD